MDDVVTPTVIEDRVLLDHIAAGARRRRPATKRTRQAWAVARGAHHHLERHRGSCRYQRRHHGGVPRLVAFGFDSIIEVLSALVVVWQFRSELRCGYDEERERRALKAIAVTFFVLVAYVVFEAGRDLFFTDGQADVSTVGIVLAALSLAVMPALGFAKRRTAVEPGTATAATVTDELRRRQARLSLSLQRCGL